MAESLTSPEPHHLPGYGGHCPRYKFGLGQTYGKLTSQLLTGREGARPAQPLLQPICCPPATHPEEAAGDSPGANASLFSCHKIPGYTGFIPRAQHHFAKSYSQVCKEAGQEFARQLVRRAVGRRLAHQMALTPRDIERESDLPTGKKEKLQQTAFPEASAPQVPGGGLQTHGAPATAEDSKPQKYFIPGFTGFVPRARYMIGASYPTLTLRAWAEFQQMLQKQRQEASLGSGAHRKSEEQGLPPLAKTYPTDKGLLPHYQGYVPGYKFQFGRTYGHLTCDALGRSTLEKLQLDHLP